MSDVKTVTAAMIVIGDEILSGRTKDKNIGYIADHCTAIGIRLSEVRVVSDDRDEIVHAVNALRRKHDYVFTTGGIGPTHDDITAESIAAAFSVPIDINDEAKALLVPFWENRGFEVTEARLRMTRIPQGATLIANSVSIAPGFMIENVIVMAGIPKVMHVMLDAVTPKLRTGVKLQSQTLKVTHAEGDVAVPLSKAQDRFPDVSMGSYPFVSEQGFGTQLVLRSTDQDQLEKAMAALLDLLDAEGIEATRVEV